MGHFQWMPYPGIMGTLLEKNTQFGPHQLAHYTDLNASRDEIAGYKLLSMANFRQPY